MNNKNLIFGVFVSSMILLMLSCETKYEITENKVQFDTLNIVKVHHLKNDSTQPSCNLKVTFIYPSFFDNENTLTAVQENFLMNFFGSPYKNNQPNEAIEKYGENYVNNYKEDVKIFFKEKENDFSEDGHTDNYFSYYEKLSNEITFNKANLISYRINQTNFKGGGNSFQQYLNHVYDLNENKPLSETDIFNDGYDKILNSIFKNKLLTANKVETISELEDFGYFGIDEIMPNGNFLLNETGITYTFNRGEYSALQLDEINIFIPYKAIDLILKENSPISIFLKP